MKHSQKNGPAADQRLQQCSAGGYKSDPFDKVFSEWRELVEEAEAHGREPVTVLLRHEPNMDLVPILMGLRDYGICVSAICADKHDFLLELQKGAYNVRD
jgi:hypothetical protein